MQNTYGNEVTMPNLFKKFDQMALKSVASHSISGNAEVHVQPGAGEYEPSFRSYWLVTAWGFLFYQALAMGTLIVSMAAGANLYQWLTHLVCTVVIVFGTGFMACIYRFILFPVPTYFSSVPDMPQPQPYTAPATFPNFKAEHNRASPFHGGGTTEGAAA
jgi:hypothetical protein